MKQKVESVGTTSSSNGNEQGRIRKAKQLDEKKGNEIKRKLEEEMNTLQIREERVRVQAEEKSRRLSYRRGMQWLN